MEEHSFHLKAVIWIIAITYVLVSMSSSLIAPIEANFILGFLARGDVRLVGVPLSVGMLFFPVFAIIFGCYAEMAKKFAAWAMLLTAAAIAAAVISGNIVIYSLAKIPWALALALGGPVMLTILQHQLHSRSNFDHLFGYLNAAMAIIGAIFAFMGGFLGQQQLARPYILLVILFAAVGVLLLLKGRKIREEDHQHTEGITRSAMELCNSAPLVFFVFYAMTYPVLYINMSLRPLIWPQFFSDIPRSHILVGSLFSCMGLVALGGSFLFGSLVKRFGLKKVILSAAGLFWVCTAGIVYGGTNIPLLCIYAGGIAFSESMMMPARSSIIRGNIHKRLFSAFGGFETVISSVISSFVMILFGQLQARAGIDVSFQLILWFNALTMLVLFSSRKALNSSAAKNAAHQH